MSLLMAITASLVVICLFAVSRAYADRQRRKRFKGLELRPNCLLTRYPIVFLARPKSLFRPFDEWRDVPLFLREHGYEVLILTPVRNAAVESILSTLRDLDCKCHLLAVESQAEIMNELADARLEQVASLTLVKKKSVESRKAASSAGDLRPSKQAIEAFVVPRSETLPKLWQFEGRFLDYAISLAERDAGWCDL